MATGRRSSSNGSSPATAPPDASTAPTTRRTAKTRITQNAIESQQNTVSDTESAKNYLSKNLLCIIDEPFTIPHLISTLFHITQMTNISLPVISAIRAVAFLLKEHNNNETAKTISTEVSNHLSQHISNHIVAAIAPQVAKILTTSESLNTTLEQAEKLHRNLTQEKDELTADATIAAERIEEAANLVWSSIEDCQNTFKTLSPSLNETQHQIDKLSTQIANQQPGTQIPHQQRPSYSDIVSSYLPPTADKAIGRSAIRARQLTIQPTPGDSIFPSNTPHSEIFDRIKDAFERIKDTTTPAGKILTVKILQSGGLTIEFESEPLAKWYQDSPRKDEIRENLQTEVSFHMQSFSLIIEYIPISTRIDQPDFLRTVENDNNLPLHSLTSIRWLKPLNRRSEHQRRAFAMLQTSDVHIANGILKDGIILAAQRLQARKNKKEPTRCAKCQHYGHYASTCKETTDTCGTCKGAHRTSDCNSYRTNRCANCNANDHSSWNRECPEFIRQRELLDNRLPENRMPYFPTEHSWTHAMFPLNPTAPSRPQPPSSSNNATTAELSNAVRRPMRQTTSLTPASHTHPICAHHQPATAQRRTHKDPHLPRPYLPPHLLQPSHPRTTRPHPPPTKTAPNPTNTQMPRETISDPKRLRIWQQNLNASLTAQESLLNGPMLTNWDIIAIQEPHINFLRNTRANHHWHVIYPSQHHTHPTQRTRAITLINTSLDTNSWSQVHFPSSDVVAIQIVNSTGRCTIFNIYNDGNHQDTIHSIQTYLTQNIAIIRTTNNDSMIWLGDFNRHHPLWEAPRNRHLFNYTASQPLIDMIADFEMFQILPAELPTLQSTSTGNWTRPDNVFGTSQIQESVISCTTEPSLRGPKTDHVPILLELDLQPSRNSLDTIDRRNWKKVDWEEFNKQLSERLSPKPPLPLASEDEFQSSARHITKSITDTIESCVPTIKSSSYARRWWTKQLSDMRKQVNRLSRKAYQMRALPLHQCHQELKTLKNAYAAKIEETKLTHWINWLEDLEGNDLWTANNYITSEPSDGGKARIPTLTTTASNGTITHATSNEEKSEAIAKAFFPPAPQPTQDDDINEYPDPIGPHTPFTKDQIKRAITKLSGYKAPGPDGICNIVFKECTNTLTPYLEHLFNGVFTHRTYHEPWKRFTTVVLRKPGKKSYSTPKAYRPIALLNSTCKLLTALVAEQLTFILEHHQLLPNTHFGGRPGRSTTDSIHLLENTIKNAWRSHKVASALFLDIEHQQTRDVLCRLVQVCTSLYKPHRCTRKSPLYRLVQVCTDELCLYKFNNFC